MLSQKQKAYSIYIYTHINTYQIKTQSNILPLPKHIYK